MSDDPEPDVGDRPMSGRRSDTRRIPWCACPARTGRSDGSDRPGSTGRYQVGIPKKEMLFLRGTRLQNVSPQSLGGPWFYVVQP